MSKKLVQRIWNSPTLTTWGDFSIKSINLIIITPLVLTKFPVELISIWYLFSTIITLNNLIDLGFFPTFSRLVSHTMGGAKKLGILKGNFKEGDGKPNWVLMEKLYGNIGLVYLVLSFASLILISTGGTLALLRPMSLINDQSIEVVSWQAWIVLIIGVTITFYGRKFKAVLHGMNYVALVNRWNMLFSFINVISCVIVLFINGNILHLIIVNQSINVLNVIRNYFLLRFVENKYFTKYKYLSFNKDVFKVAWGTAWRSALGIIGSTGITQATGLIYAQISDPSNLASYLISLKFISVAAQFSQAPFYSKLPLFARLRSEKKIIDLKNLTARSMRFSLIIFILIAFCIGFFSNPLLKLIDSNAFFVSRDLWALMLFVWFLERHHAMHAQIYSTTNHIPFYIPIIISGLINLGLMIFLIEKIDIWAFPVSQLISNMLINNWWNVKISLKSLNTSFWNYSKYNLTIILPILFLTILLLLFFKSI